MLNELASGAKRPGNDKTMYLFGYILLVLMWVAAARSADRIKPRGRAILSTVFGIIMLISFSLDEVFWLYPALAASCAFGIITFLALTLLDRTQSLLTRMVLLVLGTLALFVGTPMIYSSLSSI